MSNRKATFAKRNREMELKEHAKNKEARREQRKQGTAGRENKGPEIAWDQAVDQSAVINAANAEAAFVSLVPRDDSAISEPLPPPPPAPAPPPPSDQDDDDQSRMPRN